MRKKRMKNEAILHEHEANIIGKDRKDGSLGLCITIFIETRFSPIFMEIFQTEKNFF